MAQENGKSVSGQFWEGWGQWWELKLEEWLCGPSEELDPAAGDGREPVTVEEEQLDLDLLACGRAQPIPCALFGCVWLCVKSPLGHKVLVRILRVGTCARFGTVLRQMCVVATLESHPHVTGRPCRCCKCWLNKWMNSYYDPPFTSAL